MNNINCEFAQTTLNGLFANNRNKTKDFGELPVSRNKEDHLVFDTQDTEWRYARKSIIDGSLTLRREKWKSIKDVVSIPSVFDKQYQKAKERIIQLCQNRIDELAPNENVQDTALDLLRLLKNQKISPSLINSTGDESLLFEFFVGENVFSLDIYNSGEIIFVVNIKNRLTHVYEFNRNQIKEVISKFTLTYE